MKRRAALAAWFCVCCAAGCGGDLGPEETAIAFIETYVYEANQEKALLLSDALAAEKLRKELAEVAPHRQDGFEEAAQRPPIHRTLVDKTQEDDKTILYTYRVETRPKSGGVFSRMMLIHLKRSEKGWRVINYDFWND
ncbi:MAG: hypothetical protein OXT69_03780 [Candidatus Poribacteria bacterium]|nr:hypothetical protein [Candidatus Poribacteria bacterium]